MRLHVFMQIRDALGKYLVQLSADGRSGHTLGSYRRHIGLLADWWGARSIEELGHEDLAEYLSSPVARARRGGGERAATTMNQVRSALRTFFSHCHRAGYLDSDPGRLIRRARCASKPARILTEDEQARLLAAIDHPRDLALISVMLRCGVRLGAAVGIDVGDVDFADGSVLLRNQKNGSPQRVYVPGEVQDLLRDQVGDRDAGPVFESRAGLRISPRHVGRRLRAWCRLAGVREISPHGLRHAFATSLYRRTGDVLLVSAALGHASVATTMTYARADRERLRGFMEEARAMRQGFRPNGQQV